MPINKQFLTARWAAIIGTAAIAACASSCVETTDSAGDEFAPVFWQQKDEFTEMDSYHLDAKIWINQEDGQYLDLQFQCFRHFGAQLSINQQLLVSSAFNPDAQTGGQMYVDAVLFKSEGQSPQVYRDGVAGKVHSTFTSATLDLGRMLFLDENGSYRDLHLRFVHGVSPVEAEYGDVDQLSREDSVDFELSSSNPEAAKFLQACAPVKNWKPSE